jgi:hypothetical protein
MSDCQDEYGASGNPINDSIIAVNNLTVFLQPNLRHDSAKSDAASVSKQHLPGLMPTYQRLSGYRLQYTLSLPKLAQRPRATRRPSFSWTPKQYLFSLLLCNALPRCNLVIRLMHILKQLQSLNQPIILRWVQNDGSATPTLCKHQGPLVRLHLLDQLRSVRSKCGNRLDILLYA